MDLTDARISALVDAYLKADYRWELDGNWRRFHVGAPATEIEEAFPDAERFALVSAWDPHSIPRDEAANRAEDETLHQLIAGMSYPRRPGFSSAPDRTWREPSWLAIGMPTGVLDALARRFGQLGTLGWERGQPVRLRMDAAPPPGQAGHDCVDWLK